MYRTRRAEAGAGVPSCKALLEDICYMREASNQTDTMRCHLYEVPRVMKLTEVETEYRMIVCRGRG